MALEELSSKQVRLYGENKTTLWKYAIDNPLIRLNGALILSVSVNFED